MPALRARCNSMPLLWVTIMQLSAEAIRGFGNKFWARAEMLHRHMDVARAHT